MWGAFCCANTRGNCRERSQNKNSLLWAALVAALGEATSAGSRERIGQEQLLDRPSLRPSSNQPERRPPLTVSRINFHFQHQHHHEMLPTKASDPPSLWNQRQRVKQIEHGRTHTGKLWSLSNDLSVQTSRSESTTISTSISCSLAWRPWRCSCY